MITSQLTLSATIHLEYILLPPVPEITCDDNAKNPYMTIE